ncbi:MAG: hypothetical protein K2K21_01370 [Lachnospiraceae bacterium]|nr:hypothetical protein [Lachnospiraceae bacterium]
MVNLSKIELACKRCLDREEYYLDKKAMERTIEEQNAEIAEKDVEIQKLRAEIEKLKNSDL